MTDDVEGLIERLEKVTGPDRELDEAIARLCNWCPLEVAAEMWAEDEDKPEYWFSDAFGMPHYTASIDAALALTERLFGVEANSMLYNYDLGWHASAWAEMAFTADLHLAVGTPPEMKEFHGQSYTMPLAILIAILRALRGST